MRFLREGQENCPFCGADTERICLDDDDNSHLKIRCLNPECGAEWHLFSKE